MLYLAIIMENKSNKSNTLKSYLPYLTSKVADKTHIDEKGHMQDTPTVDDVLKQKIGQQSPHAPNM